MKLGEKVYEFEVEINNGEIEHIYKEHKVIGVNSIKFCINNLHFSSFDLDQSRGQRDFGVPFIVDMNKWGKLWRGRMDLHLYTKNKSKVIASRVMNKYLKKYIESQVGCYMGSSNININF